jgi:uncharacterized repeat protein (TIGR01451 family)
MLVLIALVGERCFAELQGSGQTIKAGETPARLVSDPPMSFEANQGQTAAEVKFLARGRGYTLFLSASEAVLSLRGESALRMNLGGANPQPEIQALAPLPGRANYFIGNDPKQWRTEVETYAKVHYREVYPGIDMVYYGKRGQLEFDFVLQPGAAADAIRLRFEGANGLRLEPDGTLAAQMQRRAVRWPKPLVYQMINGVKSQIAANYVLRGANEAGFQLGSYDSTIPLVIDPVLIYATELGGSDLDSAEAMAVDSSGNVYLTGETASLNFPTRGAYRASLGGSNDVFVTKLNSNGTALVYSTYFGGSGDDFGQGIAVDGSGNVYVTGQTDSPNFPTHNAYQSSLAGSGASPDAFLVKLGPTGSTLLYATYFGGPDRESATGIALDSAGNAYLAGLTGSGAQFPKVSPFQNNNGGGTDGFVGKFDPTASGGASLIYASWLGGTDEERCTGIAVDASGNAYVCGEVLSLDGATTSFPVVNAWQAVYGGGDSDAFVAKINAAGSQVLFATLLGGEGEDSALCLTLDSANNIYVAGQTSSSAFPITANAAQAAIGGDGDFFTMDAFVSNIEANGTALLYSTYLGGDLNDSAAAVAVDSGGQIYVIGQTESSFNFPITSGADQDTSGGPTSGFVSKINPAVPGPSALVYSSYLGGSGNSLATDIALNTNGDFYVCGLTDSSDFTRDGAYQTNFAGGYSDAFVARLSSPADLSVSIVASTNPVLVGSNLTYTLQVNNNWHTTFTGVVLTDSLPAGVQVLSITASGMSCANSSGTITCNVGTLTNNASASVSIVVKTSVPGELDNSASLVANEPENNLDNNYPTLFTTVRGFSDLAIGQTDAPDPVFLSSNLTYSISFTNKGPWPATQLFMTNVLAPGATFISSTQSLFGPDPFLLDTNVLLFEFDEDLPVNGHATISLVVSPTVAGTITNQIGVFGFELDTNAASNVSSITTTVNPLADLSLSASGSPDTVFVGSNVVYTLTVSNKGPAIATSVVLTNRMAAGANFVSIKPASGCSVAGNIVTCNLGNVAPGGVVTETLEMMTTVAGSQTNICNVRSGVADLPLTDNTVTNINTALPQADLALTMTDAPDPVILTSNLVYTLVVTNRGLSTATTVMLTNTLPSKVNFLSAVPSQGSFTHSGNTLVCSFGSIAAGTSALFTITVGATNAGLVTNMANVVAAVTDPVLANNSASVSTKVNTRPTISTVAAQTINEDTGTGAIPVTIGDAETPAASLVLSASSSNPALVSNSSITLGGSGANRTVAVVPLANQSGSATITLTVTDGDGASASNSLLLTVNSVNDPPTLNAISDLVLFTNSGPQTVNLTGITSGAINEAQILTVTATSSQTSLVPNPTVTYSSPATNGSLLLHPSMTATGTALITVTVQDNGGTANGGQNSTSRTFNVIIRSNPLLQITRTNNRVVLAWPTNAAGFHLQSLTNFSNPTNWNNVPDASVVVGVQRMVTNTISAAPKFYRLRNP